MAVLLLGRLSLSVVGFVVVVTRGWGGLLGSDVLHKWVLCGCSNW